MTKENNIQTKRYLFDLYRWPMIFLSLMIYFLAFYLRMEVKDIGSIQTSTFFTLYVVQSVSNYFSSYITRFSKLLYLFLQIVIIVSAGILISPGENMLYIGMLPLLGLQIVTLYDDVKLFTFLVILVPFQVIIVVLQYLNSGFFLTIMSIQSSMALNIIFFITWRFYRQQVSQLIKTQSLLNELQVAYTEVKEISQQNERNRIGRDLHDTLMQGLVGVTMQLEGTKLLLLNHQVDRATQEIDKTISLTRDSLQEARQSVYDMRKNNNDQIKLRDRLDKLVKVFHENYSLSVNLGVDVAIAIPKNDLEEIIRIISESLTNIVKHSQTDVAIVKVSLDDVLSITIIDYGVGFNVKWGIKKSNHFGLNAIIERVEKLGGTTNIFSHAGEGTRIDIKIPKKLRWQHGE